MSLNGPANYSIHGCTKIVLASTIFLLVWINQRAPQLPLKPFYHQKSIALVEISGSHNSYSIVLVQLVQMSTVLLVFKYPLISLMANVGFLWLCFTIETAHYLQRRSLIKNLMTDFTTVNLDDISTEFVYECLPLMFEILKQGKVNILFSVNTTCNHNLYYWSIISGNNYTCIYYS